MERELGGFEGVGLGHRVFGAVERVEDELAVEGGTDASGAGDLGLGVAVDEENAVAAGVAGDVDVFADLHGAIGAEDERAPVAPSAGGQWVEPIEAAEGGGSGVEREAGFAEVFETGVVGMIEICDAGEVDGGVGGSSVLRNCPNWCEPMSVRMPP